MTVAEPGLEDRGQGTVSSSNGKLAIQVARRIEAEVIRRGWPIGESLGSEPELRARYGVSRSVLREAVRLVEHHQVARMRRGPNGGLFITEPDAGPAAQAMVILLEHQGTTLDELIQTRRLLEPLAAALAAESITEEGIDQLREILEREKSLPDTPSTYQAEALPMALGELSANPVLRLFIEVLVRLTSRYSLASRSAPISARRKARTEAYRFHADIVDAVVAGDAGRAETRLAEYLDAVLAWIASSRRRQDAANQVVTSDRSRPDPHAKLAEVVAGRIRDDLVAGNRTTGEVVGSEADLLERYGVSRAVLREAVRLLEHHSVARMRRGPGGGLVVSTPDPQACVDTMALYLAYLEVTGEDLVAVREALELGMISRVTAQYDQPEVSRRLNDAVLAMPGDGDRQSWADLFHTELAHLAGNQVLELFLRILTELWRRHATAAGTTATAGSPSEVQHAHRKIADAILAGDEGVARHRLRRHLAALNEWWH